MKRINFNKIIVFFCIILPFLFGNNALAYEYGIEFDSMEVNGNPDDGEYLHSNVISATQDANGAINIVADTTTGKRTTNITIKQPGVYTFDVTGLSQLEQEQLFYSLTNKYGNTVRLAAFQNNNGDFETFSSRTEDNLNTSITVYLDTGEYKLALNDGRASDTQDTSFSGQYNISVKKENTGEMIIAQSGVSSRIVSANDTREYQLEELIPDFSIKDGGQFIFNYDDGQSVYDNKGNRVGEYIDGEIVEDEGFVTEYLINPLEETICDLMLAAGDFFTKVLDEVLGEEVTVTALVYNEIDAVNPNFFDDSNSGSGMVGDIKSTISKWYGLLMKVVISVYLVALLAIGVQILYSSTGAGMSRGKQLIVEWLKGIVVFAFMPYLIKYGFEINEAIVDLLRDEASSSSLYNGASFDVDSDDWSPDIVEFRSPEYVSRYTGMVAYGSEAMTLGYMKKISIYEQRLDLMRIMRAYAGATKKIVYAIIWWILIGQLVSFIVMYYKRFFIISFLIVMFPLACLFKGFETARGRRGPQLSNWAKELFGSIFTQTVHAIIYTIITSVCVTAVQLSSSSAALNWIIIIIAINFVGEGERILKKIIGAATSTVGDFGAAARGIRGGVGKVRQGVGKIVGMAGHRR